MKDGELSNSSERREDAESRDKRGLREKDKPDVIKQLGDLNSPLPGQIT
jgi:hypothetical protein